MNRLQEEIKEHTHGDLCNEVNEMIIALKLNNGEIYDNSSEDQRLKIDKARKNHKQPTAQDLIELLSRVLNEMNQCTKPYRIR